MGENAVNAINPEINNGPNNKTNTFNLVIGIATLLIALLGATFAYFSATARSAENDVTVKSAYVSISYDGGTEIKATNLIPSSETVMLSKYMKEVEVFNPDIDGELITDYDKYSSEMLDRKCVDAKGKEVCYVYQFSVTSEGIEGGSTDILASIKINKNEFINLSYVIYEVGLREENGTILTDKYGFDIVDTYDEAGKFDNIDTNPDNVWTEEEQVKYAVFERPSDILDESGSSIGILNPVACLFGYNKDEESLALSKDDTDRCMTYSISNNTRHTFQVVIWLQETGEIQDEQGRLFEGTVSIEVDGGADTGEYSDGEITGRQ